MSGTLLCSRAHVAYGGGRAGEGHLCQNQNITKPQINGLPKYSLLALNSALMLRLNVPSFGLEAQLPPGATTVIIIKCPFSIRLGKMSPVMWPKSLHVTRAMCKVLREDRLQVAPGFCSSTVASHQWWHHMRYVSHAEEAVTVEALPANSVLGRDRLESPLLSLWRCTLTLYRQCCCVMSGLGVGGVGVRGRGMCMRCHC